MIVQFRNMVEADVRTIRQHMPFSIGENTAGMVAYNPRTSETLGIIVGQEWTETSCAVHQVILNPMVLRPKYEFLENAARWFFTHAGLLKIYGLVPENNWKARSLNEKFGFREVCVLEDAYAKGVDFILMELNREDCPYWKADMEKVANG